MSPGVDIDENGVLIRPCFVADLPERRQRLTGRVAAVRALLPALKEHPNVWAQVMEHEEVRVLSSVVSTFNKGSFGPAQWWDTATRRHSVTERYQLFVRYLGPVKG